MALDRSRSGSYKVFKTLEDMEVKCISLFGDVSYRKISKGSKIYECINYFQRLRTHYFSKPVGNGGFKVATFAEVENSPERFQYICTKHYDFLD